jgi:ketosteroid isomerase-like protein
MKRTLVGVVVGILVCAGCIVHAERSGDARGYIEKCEQDWVESGANADTAAVKRCLADDFLGVNIDGSRYDKANEISNIQSHRNEFKSNRLGEVKVRFYGDAAVAQGTEVWEKRTGERGRFVWTDTWIRRNNLWQIVAAEAVRAQPTAK